MSPQKCGALSAMTVRVHTHLHERLPHRTVAARDERVLYNPSDTRFGGGFEPRGLLFVSAAELLNERLEAIRHGFRAIEYPFSNQHGAAGFTTYRDVHDKNRRVEVFELD